MTEDDENRRDDEPLRCDLCGWRGIGSDRLAAPSPFDSEVMIYGCPDCKSISGFVRCDSCGRDAVPSAGLSACGCGARVCQKCCISWFSRSAVQYCKLCDPTSGSIPKEVDQ
jgi:predicted RNA-binding Zn-ribbon protein involved in translation (DUF1610 family)